MALTRALIPPNPHPAKDQQSSLLLSYRYKPPKTPHFSSSRFMHFFPKKLTQMWKITQALYRSYYTVTQDTSVKDSAWNGLVPARFIFKGGKSRCSNKYHEAEGINDVAGQTTVRL